jgi:phosphoglycerol transferase MdoB-like AlkP superfamily enzyme
VRLLVLYRSPLLAAALLLAACSASRLLLLAQFWERVAETGGLAFILLQGMRFDLVLVGLLIGPLLAIKPLACRLPGYRAVERGYLLLVVVLSVFVEATSLPFIREYDVRPNSLFVEYLVYPREVLSTLLRGYGPELAGALVLVAFSAWLTWRLTAEGARRTVRVPWLTTLWLTPLMLVVVAAMVRSTLDHRPVNPSTVAFSADSMVNQLPLNSPYTLLYAVYEQHRDRAAGQTRYGSLPEEDVLATVLEDAGLEDHRADYASPSMHFQRASRHARRPLNLVIVLEESLGAEFVGSLGGHDLTPNLDALASQGIWLERLYATGTRSVRGIEAVITGFLPTPRRSVVKLAETQQHFFTLAGLLRDHGYQTSFIYGGEAHFDNMARFFLNNGFQEVIDEDDYQDPVFYGSWGVSDEDLFERAHRHFAAASGRPFFSLVFTSSNHTPFDIPPGRVAEVAGPDGARETAVRYADYALGRFLARARSSDYYDDTVFLVIADHNSRTYGDQLVPIERFHIPGVIFGGSIEPRRVPGITSQIDMLPTLLSLIGVDSVHPAIGRDLTRREFARGAGRAMMQFNAIQAYLEPCRVLIMQPDREPQEFAYAPEAGITPRPATDLDFEHRGLAYASWAPVTLAHHYYFNAGHPPPAIMLLGP